MLLVVVLVAAVAAGDREAAVAANRATEILPRRVHHVERGWVIWEDDLETGAAGWTHGDDSYIPPKFHVDSYLAYDDPEHETDYSWWCGELNPEFLGGDGYGNRWNQSLELPPIDLGIVAVEHTSWSSIKAMYREGAGGPGGEAPAKRSASPVLSFRYTHDTEAGWDFVWVEAFDGQEWVALHEGYDGRSGGWQVTDPDEFDLAGCVDPIQLRFHFVSDPAYSDEDGYYQSWGGAIHVDDISVHDAVTGEVYYWEDCEGGVGQSQPTSPPPAGDYWHLVDNACQAYSGTHAWSCSHPDSTAVPPNLHNWLTSPVVDVATGATYACTLHFTYQLHMSGYYGGSWQEWGTNDGGATWIRTGWWYGDQCAYGYGPCDHFISEIPISWLGWQGTGQAAGKWVILTDQDGNYADPTCPYETAGLIIDDTWVEVWYW